jgi:hypothetical protein
MSLCPPQIPHDLIRARTRAAAVSNRRLNRRICNQPSFQEDVPSIRSSAKPLCGRPTQHGGYNRLSLPDPPAWAAVADMWAGKLID